MFLSEIEATYNLLKKASDFSIYDITLSEVEKSLFVKDIEEIIPYRPALIENMIGSMEAEDAEVFKKIIILNSAIQNWEYIFSKNYPISVTQQYEKTLQRIYKTCQSEKGWCNFDIDIYWKDLAMTRRIIYPAGAQIVEFFSGFSSRQGLTFNFKDSFNFVRFLLSNGGSRGYFQIHTHIPELKQFNELGWNDCYVRIAEMLEMYPQIKGVFGGSWFYDRKIETVSPNLFYLQKTPLENGAHSFYVGKDITGNALAKSKTRKKLYDEGKYDPASNLLIWPRERLIEWAHKYKIATQD